MADTARERAFEAWYENPSGTDAFYAGWDAHAAHTAIAAPDSGAQPAPPPESVAPASPPKEAEAAPSLADALRACLAAAGAGAKPAPPPESVSPMTSPPAAARQAGVSDPGATLDDLVNDLLANTPEGFGGDVAAEVIAVRWVRHLEARVAELEALASDAQIGAIAAQIRDEIDGQAAE